eukprot:6008444-Prymnesium_polylepis.1
MSRLRHPRFCPNCRSSPLQPTHALPWRSKPPHEWRLRRLRRLLPPSPCHPNLSSPASSLLQRSRRLPQSRSRLQCSQHRQQASQEVAVAAAAELAYWRLHRRAKALKGATVAQ